MPTARTRVVAIGGGLAGIAAVLTVAAAPNAEVQGVEAGRALGGLAGNFEHEGRSCPLGYHHILGHDRALLGFLDRIGATGRIRWARPPMLFQMGSRLYAPGSVLGFLAFPLARPMSLPCAIFVLTALTRTSGREACLNFVIHLASGQDPLFGASDAELRARYSKYCSRVFGRSLEANWSKVLRVASYSPVFSKRVLPPAHSEHDLPQRALRWELPDLPFDRLDRDDAAIRARGRSGNPRRARPRALMSGAHALPRGEFVGTRAS